MSAAALVALLLGTCFAAGAVIGMLAGPTRVPCWLSNWWRNRHTTAAGRALALGLYSPNEAREAMGFAAMSARAHEYLFPVKLHRRLEAVARWPWRDERWEWVG